MSTRRTPSSRRHGAHSSRPLRGDPYAASLYWKRTISCPVCLPRVPADTRNLLLAVGDMMSGDGWFDMPDTWIGERTGYATDDVTRILAAAESFGFVEIHHFRNHQLDDGRTVPHYRFLVAKLPIQACTGHGAKVVDISPAPEILFTSSRHLSDADGEA